MSNIRPATKSDMKDLVDMWQSFMDYHRELRSGKYRLEENALDEIRERFHRYMEEEDRCVFVVVEEENDSEAAGFAVARIEEGSDVFQAGSKARITDFFVRPDYRGRNFGLRLVKRIKQWARDEGAEALFMSIDANNEIGKRFWDGLNFERVRETYEISL